MRQGRIDRADNPMTQKWPEKAGWYWFFGFAFKFSGSSDSNPILRAVEVGEAGSGLIYLSNGDQLYRGEARGWWSKEPIPEPQIPEGLSEKIKAEAKS